MESSSVFDELRGEQLSGVTFVQDYLQLWFDGPGINVYNPLTVTSEAGVVSSWGVGFRDALCEQITNVVADVTHQAGESLVITFEDGASLVISLRAEDYTGPEAYYFHNLRKNIMVVE